MAGKSPLLSALHGSHFDRIGDVPQRRRAINLAHLIEVNREHGTRSSDGIDPILPDVKDEDRRVPDFQSHNLEHGDRIMITAQSGYFSSTEIGGASSHSRVPPKHHACVCNRQLVKAARRSTKGAGAMIHELKLSGIHHGVGSGRSKLPIFV